MRAIDVLLVWGVGAVIAIALRGKLEDPCWAIRQIESTVGTMAIGASASQLGRILVFTEAVVVLLLLVLPRWRLVTASALALFFVFQVVLFHQGLQQGFGVGCSCGGKAGSLPVWGAMLRNTLAMTALIMARRLQCRPEVRI